MVEIIGLGTMGALLWLLAWSMAGESESEKRRILKSCDHGRSGDIIAGERRARHAA